MNHMGIPFDGHQLIDFDAADGGDPADIVAAEIDQHDMLGAFFRVGQQFGFELALFFRRGAAPARAGDGAQLDGIAGEPHHGFRRRADDPQVVQLQVIHVGRRIDESQRAVDFKRIAVGFGFESLAQHGLNDVAGFDIFLGPVDRLLKASAAQIGAEFALAAGLGLSRAVRCRAVFFADVEMTWRIRLTAPS